MLGRTPRLERWRYTLTRRASLTFRTPVFLAPEGPLRDQLHDKVPVKCPSRLTYLPIIEGNRTSDSQREPKKQGCEM